MLPESQTELQAYLKELAAAGFDAVPVAKDKKAPSITGWPDVERFDWPAFAGRNIGCRGTRVIPVDIDEPVTAQIALAVFSALLEDAVLYDGRPSRPVSHFYFNVPDGAPRLSRASSPFRHAYYHAPAGLRDPYTYCIELKHHRGLQAVMAPSVHPSGETLSFYSAAGAIGQGVGLPPTISAAELERALSCIWLARALCVLWQEGHRHHLALWAGTWLFRGGVTWDEARSIWCGLEGALGDVNEFRGAFMADWRADNDEPRGAKGITGVQEIAENVLGTADAGAWFERVSKVWPGLRVGGAAAVGTVPGLVVQAADRFGQATANGTTVAGSAGRAGAVWTDGAEAALRRLQRECAFLMGQGEGQVHDMATGAVCSVRAYRQAMGRVGREWTGARGGVHFEHVIDAWLDSTDKRVARATAYLPEHPYGAVVDGVINTFRRGAVWASVWRRWRAGWVDAEAELWAEPAWWLSWVERVIPDEVERSWFHRWVAHLLVHPERLPGWALYMMTPMEGVGRTSLARGLRNIMGRENVRAVSMDELVSGYNNWAADSVFRYANEVRESGGSRGTVAAKLQDAIADEDMGVTRKYAASTTVRNFGGYWLISNSVSDMHLRGMSRRYCCIANSTQKPTREEMDTFNACLNDSEALEAVCAWYFQLWDLDPTLPREAPHTPAFDRVRQAGATESELAVEDAMEAFGSPLFAVDQFIKWYEGPLVDVSEKSRQMRASHMLRAAGFEKLRRVDVDGVKRNVQVLSTRFNEFATVSTKWLAEHIKGIDARVGPPVRSETGVNTAENDE